MGDQIKSSLNTNDGPLSRLFGKSLTFTCTRAAGPAGLISRNEGAFASAQITSRLKVYGASYRTKLNDSVVWNSPLVVTKENRGFVWGVYYAFWQSSQTVTRSEK